MSREHIFMVLHTLPWCRITRLWFQNNHQTKPQIDQRVTNLQTETKGTEKPPTAKTKRNVMRPCDNIRVTLLLSGWGLSAWWRHQMETFSALLALCERNSPVAGAFPSQRPETRSFDVFFDLRLNKRLSKQSWGWWFEMPSRSSWRHCNAGG